MYIRFEQNCSQVKGGKSEGKQQLYYPIIIIKYATYLQLCQKGGKAEGKQQLLSSLNIGVIFLIKQEQILLLEILFNDNQTIKINCYDHLNEEVKYPSYTVVRRQHEHYKVITSTMAHAAPPVSDQDRILYQYLTKTGFFIIYIFGRNQPVFIYSYFPRLI